MWPFHSTQASWPAAGWGRWGSSSPCCRKEPAISLNVYGATTVPLLDLTWPYFDIALVGLGVGVPMHRSSPSLGPVCKSYKGSKVSLADDLKPHHQSTKLRCWAFSNFICTHELHYEAIGGKEVN